jgi:hypothetical protein
VALGSWVGVGCSVFIARFYQSLLLDGFCVDRLISSVGGSSMTSEDWFGLS